MAKRNKIIAPVFYVYYNKATGEILSVSNELNSVYDYSLEIPFEQYDNLVSGKWQFKDYLIGYKRLPDDTTVLAVIPKSEDSYLFRNGVFEWILPRTDEAELTVEWNNHDQSWSFSTSNDVKMSYIANSIPAQLAFFVTLETDLDFLIRTITVNTSDLMQQSRILVPFISAFETDVNKISVGTRLVFKTYNLKVINE